MVWQTRTGLWRKSGEGEIILTRSTPVGCVLTIAAAGSETSDSAVLTNEETRKREESALALNRPKFAIMNQFLPIRFQNIRLRAESWIS